LDCITRRRGGDEFAVLLSSVADGATAEAVATRIHERLCEPIVIGGQELTIGASLGVTIVDEFTATDALETADRAMYGVKGQGGGVWMTAGA